MGPFSARHLHFEELDDGIAGWSCSEWGEIQTDLDTFDGNPGGNTVLAEADIEYDTGKTAQPSAYNAHNMVEGRVSAVVESHLEESADAGVDGEITWDPPDAIPVNFAGGSDVTWGLSWGDWKISREAAFEFECVVDDPAQSP